MHFSNFGEYVVHAGPALWLQLNAVSNQIVHFCPRDALEQEWEGDDLRSATTAHLHQEQTVAVGISLRCEVGGVQDVGRSDHAHLSVHLL